jgi:hypothetical protein
MKDKKIMAVPFGCFLGVIAVCLVGIIIGSFCDFNINEALANKTDIGAFFATYGSYFSYCLYPAAGMCLFKGLKKKGHQYDALAKVLLVVAYFMAVYYSNSYNGSKVRELFGYTAGESSPFMSILSWGFWVVLYAWVPIVCYFLFDDTEADKLIAVGASILIAGIVADNNVKMLEVDGVYPNAENIKNGTYPITTNFYVVYRKDTNNLNVHKLVEWLLSEEGQTMIEACGYVGLPK